MQDRGRRLTMRVLTLVAFAPFLATVARGAAIQASSTEAASTSSSTTTTSPEAETTSTFRWTTTSSTSSTSSEEVTTSTSSTTSTTEEPSTTSSSTTTEAASTSSTFRWTTTSSTSSTSSTEEATTSSTTSTTTSEEMTTSTSSSTTTEPESTTSTTGEPTTTTSTTEEPLIETTTEEPKTTEAPKTTAYTKPPPTTTDGVRADPATATRTPEIVSDPTVVQPTKAGDVTHSDHETAATRPVPRTSTAATEDREANVNKPGSTRAATTVKHTTVLPETTVDMNPKTQCVAMAAHCHVCRNSTACDFCRDAHYLLEGACVESCPAGYTAKGTGNFKRECIAPSPGGCVSMVNHCHQCADTSTCEFCRDAHYLHDGECVEACPSGYTAHGSGNFKRFCTAPSTGGCVRMSNHCHQCANSTACEFCRDAHYLHDGACVEACPAGYTPVGTGNFKRHCVAPSSGGCAPMSNHCHQCANSTACEFCRDSHYLHEGECVEACPTGYTPVGTGKFRRVCEPPVLDGSCVAMRDNCHACLNTSACSFCRNAHYLHDGACVASCPSGTTPKGSGNFKRICEPIAQGSCVALQNHCHECSDKDTCRFCRDAHYLHDGACVASCPSGTSGVGTGNFKRTCQADGLCAPQKNHCHQCADATTCGMCRDSHYLHEGECVSQCPLGRIPVGTGKYRRVCTTPTL